MHNYADVHSGKNEVLKNGKRKTIRREMFELCNGYHAAVPDMLR